MSHRQCPGCWKWYGAHILDCPHCAGMSTAHPATMVSVVDEAAIRADERAKVEEEVLSSLRMGVAMWRVTLSDAEGAGNTSLAQSSRAAIGTLQWHIADIEQGKHRSAP